MRLIDADKLNMYFADVQLVNRGWKDEFCDALDDIMDAVDEQPTIDPESLRPKGQWKAGYIDTGDGPMPEDAFGCNVCGKWQWRRSNYCPNCGARMEDAP